MNSGEESREVPVDVLPPVPKDAYAPTTREPGKDRVPFEGLNTFYHPASGVVILALDWLIFGTDLLTGFLALPAMCVLGFLATFPLVLLIQQKWSKDSLPNALGKAFLGAFMVGLPFPITGTLLGAAILALSGLPHHPVEAVKRLVSQATTK
jgi:hypothetical protein